MWEGSVYTYKNGDRYDGDYIDDNCHGHGVFYACMQMGTATMVTM